MTIPYLAVYRLSSDLAGRNGCSADSNLLNMILSFLHNVILGDFIIRVLPSLSMAFRKSTLHESGLLRLILYRVISFRTECQVHSLSTAAEIHRFQSSLVALLSFFVDFISLSNSDKADMLTEEVIGWAYSLPSLHGFCLQIQSLAAAM